MLTLLFWVLLGLLMMYRTYLLDRCHFKTWRRVAYASGISALVLFSVFATYATVGNYGHPVMYVM